MCRRPASTGISRARCASCWTLLAMAGREPCCCSRCTRGFVWESNGRSSELDLVLFHHLASSRMPRVPFPGATADADQCIRRRASRRRAPRAEWPRARSHLVAVHARSDVTGFAIRGRAVVTWSRAFGPRRPPWSWPPGGSFDEVPRLRRRPAGLARAAQVHPSSEVDPSGSLSNLRLAGVGGRGGAASGVDAGELNEEDRIDPLDGRALATNGVRHLRLRRADDDEVEPQVSGGIEACPHLDVLAVGDVSTTLDDRVVDPVSLASSIRIRDSLPLHGGVDTSRRPGPCELQGAQPPPG